MQSFLNRVVTDVLSNNVNSAGLTFVLPSKRAGIFLKNILKSKLTKTTILPKIISIEEFIQELSRINSIDNTTTVWINND